MKTLLARFPAILLGVMGVLTLSHNPCICPNVVLYTLKQAAPMEARFHSLVRSSHSVVYAF